MKWKKSSVMAVSKPQNEELTAWLRQSPEGLDSVKTSSWSFNAGDSAALYLLFGWSRSGVDELRHASLDSVLLSNHRLRIYASRPRIKFAPEVAGTDDMRFIGWEVPLDKLTTGHYLAELLVRQDRFTYTPQGLSAPLETTEGYKKAGELKFQVP